MNTRIITIILFSFVFLTSEAHRQVSSHYQDFNNNWFFWSDNDTVKKPITLPHDAMQSERRSAAISVVTGHHNGYYPGGVYHYEKVFRATSDMLKGHVKFHFGGIYRNAKIYINGRLAKTQFYGYSTFDVVADNLLRKGNNVMRVDVDNSQLPNSRWYSGSGIYRPVKMLVQPADYIEKVKVLTLSYSPAKILVNTCHHGGSSTKVEIVEGNRVVATGYGDSISLSIPNARLWSAKYPFRYRAIVTLLKNGKAVEYRTVKFGIRQISYSTKGFFVNGENVLLQGGCIHHDEGLIGAAEYPEAAFRKVARMKEYGYNAIRSAHNPCSEELLEACDSLGMYVMDEMWDMWYTSKTTYDYSQYFMDNYRRDIQDCVAKDFNHPCVVLYSIGNELSEPASRKGLRLEKEIIDLFHSLDNSRPVTAGINLHIVGSQNDESSTARKEASEDRKKLQSAVSKKMDSEHFNMMMAMIGSQMDNGALSHEVDSITTPCLDMLDIAGYNYAYSRYPLEAKLHPNRVVVGSETLPIYLPKRWKMVKELPYVIGDFMWSAWDFLGEVGTGSWYYAEPTESPSFVKGYPWLTSDEGALDLLGNPTGEALLAKTVWMEDDHTPLIGVRPISTKKLIKAAWRGTNALPSWSWKGAEGLPATVEVYSNLEKVSLYLNDSLIGEKPVKENIALFDSIRYEPGTLKAIATDADGNTFSSQLTSATGDLNLTLSPEVSSVREHGLVYINVALTGENGEVESADDRMLMAHVIGGELLAFGSANPKSVQKFTSGTYDTYHGRALAIVRAGLEGYVSLTVSSPGLIPQTVKIKVESAQKVK
jgi:hypothetical protein